MVHFEDKTGNHAKGFRIQKHLLPANESCVLALQNCCATDFRKTVIRFVARQVPRRIPPRKFGVPGRLAPFQSLSRRPPYGACRRAASTAKHRGAQAKTAKACDRPAHTTNILHTACPPQEPIIRETPSRPPEICASLIPFPLTGKAHFSALNHGGNYEKIEDLRTRDAYCVRNGRLPGPRCLLKRAH